MTVTKQRQRRHCCPKDPKGVHLFQNDSGAFRERTDRQSENK